VKRDGGIVLAVVATVVGIVAGEYAGPHAAFGTLLLGAGGLAAAWLVTGPARLAVAMCALALLGAAVMQRALHGLAVDVPTADVEVRGTVVGDPDGNRYTTELYVRVDGMHRIVFVRAASDDVGRLRAVESGDRVVLDGHLEPLAHDRYATFAHWRHAALMLSHARIEAFSAPHDRLYASANRLRAVLQRGATPLPVTERALLSGFLLGDTRHVPDDVVDQYRDAGLSHLLAVSGANVAFVLACCAPALRQLPLAGRSLAALAVVLLFATMTRFEPSVLRASAMTAVTVFAAFVGRPTTRLRVLGLAVIAMLLTDPFLVHSVGFQLSVAAAAGIAVCARPLAARLRGPAAIREALAVSLAAQAGVTPVLLVTFGSVPVCTPLTNLLAVPVAEVVGVYGFLASLIGGLCPPLAPVLQPVDGVLIRWISLVAHVGASVPYTIDRRGAVVGGVALALATLARRAHRDDAAVPAPAAR
jgi:competence protein ComEC